MKYPAITLPCKRAKWLFTPIFFPPKRNGNQNQEQKSQIWRKSTTTELWVEAWLLHSLICFSHPFTVHTHGIATISFCIARVWVQMQNIWKFTLPAADKKSVMFIKVTWGEYRCEISIFTVFYRHLPTHILYILSAYNTMCTRRRISRIYTPLKSPKCA